MDCYRKYRLLYTRSSIEFQALQLLGLTMEQLVSITACNDAILGIENVLQRLIVLQPLLSVEFPGIAQVIQSIKSVVRELNELEEEAQRQLAKGQRKT